ncbi:MAG TPA: PAS domain-containing protein, partial [Leptospiraceae bacterium]|nr:PAS domain-containing protein [Leptospiraceae bacterium]
MIDYRIIDVNAAFYNTADFTGKNVIGNTATALYGMSTESIRAFWQSHKSATTVSHTEMVSPLHQRHFLISVSPFAGNRFVTSFLDITERKRIEAEHTRALELLRTIADNVPAMIAYWTRDLRCAFANRAYEGWFGRKPDEMIGSSLDQILGPELYAKNKPYVERALAGEPQQFERTLIKPNGEIGYTWAQYVPHVHDGEVQGMIVLISDITEPRKAESRKRELEAELVQARKLESLGTLAGGVAHDFNNILGIILGHASLLKMSVKEPELTERLSTIENAAMRGGALVNQLLTFARKSETSLSLVSVNDTVRETVKLLSATFPRNIEISVQLSENLPSVMGNATQIQQALMNLCTNARDAMPDGGNLTISAKIADPSIIAAEFPKAHFSDFLLIEVKDTGVGMDTETKRRIFEPFFTTKGPGRGTGLGLSVAYSILKEHRGLFVVDSEPGQGSTFRIYLPIESNTTTATGLTIETDRSGKDTILIIEDEQMLRASLEETLVTQGYKVFTAVNGEQGVEVFQQHKDDITVVICDLGL